MSTRAARLNRGAEPPQVGASRVRGRRPAATAARRPRREDPSRCRPRSALGLAVAAVWLLAYAPAGAQVTTGRLIGSVIDEAGNPLPGAALTIASPALIGGVRSRLTDGDGDFLFINLAPGMYTVRADLEGFDSQEWTQVKVPLGGAAAVTLTLSRATFTGELVVIDETPIVDPTQVNAGQAFDVKYMQASSIGSFNRSYTWLANQIAGVADGNFGGGLLQPRIFGSTLGENAYYIDGMDVTEPLTGATLLTMNFDTLAEVQVQTAGFEAEYGRATGGVFNMVTRSGGNQVSGTVDLRLTDERLQESGEHFDADEQPTELLQTALTVGGPVVRDRLWFFAAYQHTDDRFTPTGAGFTRESSRHNYLAKLTWQAGPSWRLAARYSGDPETVDNSTYSAFTEPEATPYGENGVTVAAADLVAVLTEEVVIGGSLGVFDYDFETVPQSGDLRTISHQNLLTGVRSRNFWSQEYANTTRNDLRTDVTWFAGELAGTHEIKAGIEHSGFEQTLRSCATGSPNGERCVAGVPGFEFQDILVDAVEAPFFMWEIDPKTEATTTGALTTAFVQDAWRVSHGLTLKVGLRYDRVDYDNDGGRRVAEFDLLQPRLGVAWDLTGNGKNVARASWGRFMHPGALYLPTYVADAQVDQSRWYSCTGIVAGIWGVPIADPQDCAEFAADVGYDWRTDHEGWDPYGWVLSPSNVLADTIDVQPGLRPTYADELVLGFEREVGPRSSIGLLYVDKTTRDVFDDTCSGNIPEPGVDAECDVFVVTNITVARRDYRGMVISYETRGLEWLTLQTSYTYSSSRGSVEYTQGRGNEFDVYPWHFDNRYGYLSDHRRHRFKVNGFISVPGDWNIAFGGSWSSPFTWQPIEYPGPDNQIPYGDYFVEPRGSREANDNYQLDLQLAKGFTTGRWRLVAIGTVYNVFSSEQPNQVCTRVTGCGGGIETGDPTRWQIPRRWELGFRVEF